MTTTYTYDNNGNLEVENDGGTRTTHTWSDENWLTQVEKTGMTTNQYTFNGDGQRVQIVDSQGTKKPIWDSANILLETDGSNVTQVVYTLEPAGYGNLVSQRRSSSTSFYLFDALGSTRKLTSSGGSVTDTYDFRAYGETYASTGSTVNVFRWVGELGYYYDIDRLAYYLRARPYSPALANFLSQDPIGLDLAEPNLYSYTTARPVLWSDPSGLIPPGFDSPNPGIALPGTGFPSPKPGGPSFGGGDVQSDGTYCGELTLNCFTGQKSWPVYGNSDKAAGILWPLGGSGCVTLVGPKRIVCTGGCQAIKNWETGGISIFDHEACHACIYEDGGVFGFWTYCTTIFPDLCDYFPRESTPNW